MDARKIIDQLEHDLSHFLIDEFCKADPTKRVSSDLYKYKGLNITADTRSQVHDKTIAVRIGVLEAEFKIGSCEKCAGSLAPEEERLIMLWMCQEDVHYMIKNIFADANKKKEIKIIPFDLENFYLYHY